jgi:hypothetical protein
VNGALPTTRDLLDMGRASTRRVARAAHDEGVQSP